MVSIEKSHDNSIIKIEAYQAEDEAKPQLIEVEHAQSPDEENPAQSLSEWIESEMSVGDEGALIGFVPSINLVSKHGLEMRNQITEITAFELRRSERSQSVEDPEVEGEE